MYFEPLMEGTSNSVLLYASFISPLFSSVKNTFLHQGKCPAALIVVFKVQAIKTCKEASVTMMYVCVGAITIADDR